MDLRKRLCSKENIFLAIYTVNSYIQEKDLLDKEDTKLLAALGDVFDRTVMERTVKRVQRRLKTILDDSADYFEVTVYFKPKKYKNGQDIFRPIHTAKLIDQIAIISMLQILVYNQNEKGELIPSELSRLIPSNFFGNRISYNGRELFKRWQTQYQQYTAKANDILYKAGETKQYRYEVTLDLKNFFPSVHPQMLYNYIMEKIPLTWKNDKVIPILLRKLLIFRLCELKDVEREWYLQAEPVEASSCSYAKGLPQGLPHTYFFANLLMTMIADEYERVFPGEAVFYVDDSVIFTNGKNNKLDHELFYEMIQELNKNIQRSEKELLERGRGSEELSLPQDFCYQEPGCFGIQVHRPERQSGSDSKSYFSEIIEATKNNAERYIHGLSRETSNISLDIRTAFSDDEAKMMKSRVEAIFSLVESEIKRVQNKPDERVYLRKLIRYKKFFSYRKNILYYRASGDISEQREQLLKDIALREQEDKKEFYEKYTDDTLASVIPFVLKRCIDEDDEIGRLADAINELMTVLYGECTEHAYIRAACQPYLDGTGEYGPVDPYRTLRRLLRERYHVLLLQAQEKRWEKFPLLCDKTAKEMFEMLGLDWLYAWAKRMPGNVEALSRMLVNGLFSYLFEFEMDDQFVFAKHSKEPIQYAEVRILAALRNTDFSLQRFWQDYGEYIQDDYRRTVDYSLLQVLEAYKVFVCDPCRIDQLIQIHKYCCDTWKNGSKYLHFYTLHNQEHAVMLIRLCIRWLHAVSFFELKKIDYFILFAACYLHDISMVTLPEPEKFYAGTDTEADEIFTGIFNKFNLDAGIRATKKDLYETYQRIDNFFEQKARGSHAKDSANEIRKFSELSFLEPAMRENIAQVSEAHCYDVEDVYLEKPAGEGKINMRLIKILLRLSDLLDMSRYRISKVVLDHNLTSLNEVSRFHWISHLITDKCSIDTQYILKNKRKFGSKRIEEKLTLTVDVLMLQTTATKADHCKHISGITLEAKPGGKTKVVVQCAQGKSCDGRKCNFLCKWFVRKNNYLVTELAALKEYLTSIRENFYTADIDMCIQVVENKNLSNEIFDYLKKYVDVKKDDR